MLFSQQITEEISLPENAIQRVVVDFPPESVYIGYGNNGNVLSIGTINVSCTCSSNDGKCSPFTGPAGSGCKTSNTNPCTNCKMKVTTSAEKIVNNGGVNEIQTETIELVNGGIIDYSEGIGLVDKGKIREWEELPAAFDAMFEDTRVKQELTALVNFYYPNGVPSEVMDYNGIGEFPEGHQMYLVAAFGRRMATLLPAGLDNTSAIIAGGTPKCKCSSGSCSLKSKSVPFIGTFYSCEGDCSGTCSLNAAAIPSGGGVIHDINVAPDPVENKTLICTFISEKQLYNVSFSVTSARHNSNINELINISKGSNSHQLMLPNSFSGPCVLKIIASDENETHTVNIMVN